MIDLTGKTVLITGASRGIGAASARIFAEAGANVALAARSIDATTALAEEIGDRALALACDVSSYADVAAAIAACIDRFGALDILIGNAGMIEPIGPLAEADPDEWARAIQVNLTGVFNGMHAAIPVMKARGGTIITVSSGAAHNPLEGWSAYCASKAGAAMLTACADREERSAGLRIMGLSPGTVATDMQRTIKQSGVGPVAQLDWSDHIPPEWPARTLLWMCTADADDWIGREVSLREPGIRKRVGLA